MSNRLPQHDLPSDIFGRLSGAADVWDEGLAGVLVSEDYFEQAAAAVDCSLLASEAADTLSAGIDEGGVVALSSVEASDVVLVGIATGDVIALSASEAEDEFSGGLSEGVVAVGIELSATEGSDSAQLEMSADGGQSGVASSGDDYRYRKNVRPVFTEPAIATVQIGPRKIAQQPVQPVEQAKQVEVPDRRDDVGQASVAKLKKRIDDLRSKSAGSVRSMDLSKNEAAIARLSSEMKEHELMLAQSLMLAVDEEDAIIALLAA